MTMPITSTRATIMTILLLLTISITILLDITKINLRYNINHLITLIAFLVYTNA